MTRQPPGCLYLCSMRTTPTTATTTTTVTTVAIVDAAVTFAYSFAMEMSPTTFHANKRNTRRFGGVLI